MTAGSEAATFSAKLEQNKQTENKTMSIQTIETSEPAELTAKEQLSDFMQRHGVTVQFHKAGIDRSGDCVQFRYQAQVTRAGKSEFFDYSGGVAAFLSSRDRALLVAPVRDWRGLCGHILKGTRLIDCPDVAAAYERIYSASKPEAESLLDCLKLDASGPDTFEEWASEYGYDTDSRQAEATFRACQDNSRRLKSLLGREAFAELQQLESL
jgi:hypothetical protein